MESEHAGDVRARWPRPATAMSALAAQPGSAADAAAARASVVRTQEVVERHLTHEEEDLEPQLRPSSRDAGVEGGGEEAQPAATRRRRLGSSPGSPTG